MRHLIVTLKKLKGDIVSDLHKKYKVLNFNERLHLKKDINKLSGNVLIMYINHSIFHKKSILWSYLQEQELDNFNVIYIYGRSKNKKLFDRFNYSFHKFPQLNGATIEKAINKQRSNSISISESTEDYNHDINDEYDIDSQTDHIQGLIIYIESLKNKISELEHEIQNQNNGHKRNISLSSLDTVSESDFSIPESIHSESELDIKEALKLDPEKVKDLKLNTNDRTNIRCITPVPSLRPCLRFKANAVIVFDGHDEKESIPYKNKAERRRAVKIGKQILNKILKK